VSVRRQLEDIMRRRIKMVDKKLPEKIYVGISDNGILHAYRTELELHRKLIAIDDYEDDCDTVMTEFRPSGESYRIREERNLVRVKPRENKKAR
jgi:hypothetical protein